MGRIHLFEFEDLNRFPQILRNYLTDFLQFGINTFNVYKRIVPLIIKGLNKSNSNTIVDFASGSGGGWIKLSELLKKEKRDVKIILTDYFPNISAFKQLESEHKEVFYYKDYPINATNPPNDLKGLRTMFLSFHHFKPAEAKKILQSAIDDKTPIAIFEAQNRSFISILQMLITPLQSFVTSLLIRPFKIGRIFFTYFIPILPFIIFWDALISGLRTYSEKELRKIISELKGNNTFEWEIGKVKTKIGSVYYLLAYPI